MSLNQFVEVAVDKAALAAKKKAKSFLTGGGGADSKTPSKSGGIGGLFPSAGDSGGKEKKGGLFGGLLSTSQGENPGAGAGGAAAAGGAGGAGGAGVAVQASGGGAENADFNSAIDELSF